MIGSGVTLVTGLPGSGKTAMVVDMLSRVTDRPVFAMGIPELQVKHFPCPPVDQWVIHKPDPDDPSKKMPYFSFPPNSIVVLDEAQRVYRPRPVGSKVPDEVAAFETRRHVGVDFVLLTQDPTFIDANIRKLTARHIHIHVTSFGRYRLEWQGVGDPREASSRDLAARSKYSPPKAAFSLYKSAELHTKPVHKKPWLVYAFVPLLLAVAGGGLYVKSRMQTNMHPESTPITNKPAGVQPGQPSDKAPMTQEQYAAQFEPRLQGLPHTAPVYDRLTEAKTVPEPVGCYDSPRTGCRCITQQGTPYDTTAAICHQIMAHGLWMPWKQQEQDQKAAIELASNSPVGQKPIK